MKGAGGISIGNMLGGAGAMLRIRRGLWMRTEANAEPKGEIKVEAGGEIKGEAGVEIKPGGEVKPRGEVKAGGVKVEGKEAGGAAKGIEEVKAGLEAAKKSLEACKSYVFFPLSLHVLSIFLTQARRGRPNPPRFCPRLAPEDYHLQHGYRTKMRRPCRTSPDQDCRGGWCDRDCEGGWRRGWSQDSYCHRHFSSY